MDRYIISLGGREKKWCQVLGKKKSQRNGGSAAFNQGYRDEELQLETCSQVK